MDSELENMEEHYSTSNLEKLVIEKSCKIGYLELGIKEQSLEISKITKMLRELVNEKLQIKPSDEIVIKLNEIYKKLLKREIDSEGLLYYYPKIKNEKIGYDKLENIIQESPEYKIVQKTPKSNSAFNHSDLEKYS